ncbi:MAG: CDP-diacylglycerol--serine O-phosphatidyltransferase [Firmicutes bacterium]|nr:CDP-diacylglycerol--serine O-phosphatidyltransferase [Bacillota bacterium]HOB35584.1 CDP-diacylglycerol--serine O-phosphatidyltransferase [Bacillota bacterium]HPZ91362.1 CDP-diacylglycerol--serine O-phosphatidyltransferase [Bacillota bacterium]HQE01975.1 CDP-diacylglycerol--serine O-phosphatidyltransferase [Bacillota bacterium]
MLDRLKKILPSLCTLTNLSLGLVATVLITEGCFNWAATLIISGMLFDSFDGRLARSLAACSEFGKELDSLADLVTFGVAPALLAYRSCLYQLGWPWAALAILPFPMMGALRLARFNILSGDPSFFVGMPITLSGGLLTLFALFTGNWWAILAVMWVLSGLMISTCRYPSFKTMKITPAHILGSVAVLFCALVLLKGHAPTFFMAVLIVYMLTGIKNRWLDLRQSQKQG